MCYYDEFSLRYLNAGSLFSKNEFIEVCFAVLTVKVQEKFKSQIKKKPKKGNKLLG